MTHESYGVIDAVLSSSNTKATFFGTSSNPRNFVSLRISGGSFERENGVSWIHPEERVIELRMTCQQFALLTSGLSRNVPCTIEYIGGKKMDDPPRFDEHETIRNEFRNMTKKTTEDLRKLDQRVSELLRPNAKISKAEILDIYRAIELSICNIEKNLPYIQDKFDEYLSNSMEEAKIQAQMLASKPTPNEK